MAHITRTELDAQHIKLDVTLAPEDYIGRFDKEIKSVARNMQMKGFRPGKAPSTLVKRMYGNSVLLDTVQDILVDELNAYIEENKPSMIGSPIFSETQPDNKMSLTHPQNITFSYELGLRPELNFEEIETMRFNRYKVLIPDTEIDSTVERIRSTYKQNVDLFEGMIEEGDSFKVNFKETEGSLTGETTLSLKFLKEELHAEFIGLHIGNKITVNIFDLEKDSDVKSVRKYLLGLANDDDRAVGNMFELTLKSIVRSMPGNIGEEMFNSVFPDKNITDESTFREALRTELTKSDDTVVNRLLTHDITSELVNKISLPDTFMKNLLIFQDKSRKTTKEMMDTQYPFMADTMKRNIITTDLLQHYDLLIKEPEILDFLDKHYGVQYGVPSLGKELTKMVYDKMKKEDNSELDRYMQVLAEVKLGGYFHKKGATDEVPITQEELGKIWTKFIGREEALEYLANDNDTHQAANETFDYLANENAPHQHIEETPIEIIE